MPVLKNFSPKVLSKIKSFELCSLYNMRGSSSLDVWSKSSNPYLRKQSDSQNTKVYTLVFLSLYFHHISSWPVSPDCPWCKGSHSSIASLLTLCLSVSLWGGMWESILGQAVFMWTIIWHLHDMQRSSYIWGGFHTKMLGDYNGLKVHIFCSMLCKSWKILGNNLLTCREQCEYFISHLLTSGLNQRRGRGHLFNFEESATVQFWELKGSLASFSK